MRLNPKIHFVFWKNDGLRINLFENAELANQHYSEFRLAIENIEKVYKFLMLGANKSQFESIYHEYKNLVFNVCLHYVLNKEDAQDVTQEVFVKLYHNLNQYNSEIASLKTWIYRIAINQSLDFLKAKKTKKRFGFITSLFHPESNEPIHDVAHPGIDMEDKESLEELLRIIQSLPERQQTAIILTKIEDRPQKEVAEIMDINVKAVESLLQRAKQTIEKKLKDREGI